MDQRDVGRALRETLWPHLASEGFSERTERATWRRVDGHIDVVEIATVGQSADAVGCSAVSLTGHVASVPSWLGVMDRVPLRRGRPAPHYWQTPLQTDLTKTLSQPWFRPFSRPPTKRLLPSFAAHREGLRHVVRHDVHDRPDVWYVLDDGSNLAEVVDDLLGVIRSVGLPLLDAYHDPDAVIRLVRAGALRMAPESVAADELVEAAERHLAT